MKESERQFQFQIQMLSLSLLSVFICARGEKKDCGLTEKNSCNILHCARHIAVSSQLKDEHIREPVYSVKRIVYNVQCVHCTYVHNMIQRGYSFSTRVLGILWIYTT